MTFSYKIRKELQEKSQEQQPDMHPVNIGICGNHYIVISQILDSIFHI